MNPKLPRIFAYLNIATVAAIAAIVAGFGFGNPTASAAELPVPKVSEVTRVNPGQRPGPMEAQTSNFILKTKPQATLGDAYVIITDLTRDAYLNALDKLAAFHKGTVVRVQNLATLSGEGTGSKTEREQLRAKLCELKPKFVAIAPKPESFTEDMLSGLWKLLSALDGKSKSQLPVFPGLLIAPNQAAFESLIERSINYKPQPASRVRPFIVGQVTSPQPHDMRALQKVRMMRNMFADYGCPAQSLVVRSYNAVQAGATVAPVPNEWQAEMTAPRQALDAIPAPAKQALDGASLLIMFGHGLPGEVCSMDVRAFRDVSMSGKIILCGDCYTAPQMVARSAPQSAQQGADGTSTPPSSPAKRGGPKGAKGANGPRMSPGKGIDNSFAMRAVQNGAMVVFAHMRENMGFPHLFPVLENWTDGLTVGEAYQRLMNAIMAGNQRPDGDLLLYAIIGDPALQPFEKMKK